jgi:hypothetical protein
MSARWSPDDSAALDAQVRALRSVERAERPTPPKIKLGLSGKGRGEVTDDDMQRRHKVRRHLRRAANRKRKPPEEVSAARRAARAKRPGTVRWPSPKQKPNGRWAAKTIQNGRLYCGTFDTRAEAEAFIRQVKEQP